VKPPTVFLGDHDQLEVEAYLRDHAARRRSSCRSARPSSTAAPPRWAPIALIPTEIPAAVAPQAGARRAPDGQTTACPNPHAGFTGVVLPAHVDGS